MRQVSWLLALASYSCGTALVFHQLSPIKPWRPGIRVTPTGSTVCSREPFQISGIKPSLGCMSAATGSLPPQTRLHSVTAWPEGKIPDFWQQVFRRAEQFREFFISLLSSVW
jgi:hypothetical protein